MNEIGLSPQSAEVWINGDAYEVYMGRWSRLVAQDFLRWLAVPPKSRWLDVGCGTGVLSQTILQVATPAEVKGIDRSADYVTFAQVQVRDEQVKFEVGDAQALPLDTASFDVVVSGLVLNFIPQPSQTVAEMARVVRPGGVVAVYVWDYAGKMQFLRHFWNAAAALDPAAYPLDEGRRFPIGQPEPLRQLFQEAGLKAVEVRSLDISTDFRDFDDYWNPFLGGLAPAPGYVMSLSEERRTVLCERIKASLPFALDGSIPLVARAWAVRGIR